MIFNLVHKPALTEAYDYQRKCAREFGFKTTVLIATRNLDKEELVDIVKRDREEYGDEIGLWLTINSPEAMASSVWLFREEEKREAVKYSVEKFKELFGHAPKVIANYILDAKLLEIIKEYCPECTTCVAGCFEEGVKVYHGCNNSWYLFSEGMHWGPWYPSKTQSLRPAENEDDWAGVVALPHLCRDLVLGYEGRNDFFASHPANIQRALANDGLTHDYDYNLVDQYMMQEDFNPYESYYQINVNQGWLNNSRSVVDSNEITRTLYRETLAYIASLRDSGEVTDMYMSEFGEYYRRNVPIGGTDVALGKDLLYGSGKQFFWAINPSYRVLIDAFQGGSIGDLRPYAGKYASFTGPDSPSLAMNSYPYLIQSQYRTGIKTHRYDGSRTTAFIKCGDESLDLALYPSKIEKAERNGSDATITLKPVETEFKNGLKVTVQTVYDFKCDRIEITRKILDKSDPCEETKLCEYVKACYGYTEYPEEMKNIDLYLDEKKMCDFDYTFGKYSSEEATSASATIPEITTKVTLASTARKPDCVWVEDGNLYSPYYVLKLEYKLGENEKEITSCLKIQKF